MMEEEEEEVVDDEDADAAAGLMIGFWEFLDPIAVFEVCCCGVEEVAPLFWLAFFVAGLAELCCFRGEKKKGYSGPFFGFVTKDGRATNLHCQKKIFFWLERFL